VRELDARDATSARRIRPCSSGRLTDAIPAGRRCHSAYSCIPWPASSSAADKRVVLDENFISDGLQVRAAIALPRFLNELLGLLRQRGEALGGQVAETGRGGAAEIANFLMLQAINRYERSCALCDDGSLPPEALYGVVCVCGGRARDVTRTPNVRQRWHLTVTTICRSPSIR